MGICLRSDAVSKSLQNVVADAFEALSDEVSPVEGNHSFEGDDWSWRIELCFIFFILSIELECWFYIILSGLFPHFWFFLCELADDVLPHQRLLLVLLLQIEFFHKFKLLLQIANHWCCLSKSAIFRCEVFANDGVEGRYVDSIWWKCAVKYSLVEILPCGIEGVFDAHILLHFLPVSAAKHHAVDQRSHRISLPLRAFLQRVERIVPHVLDSWQLDQIKHLAFCSAVGNQNDHPWIYSVFAISRNISGNRVFIEGKHGVDESSEQFAAHFVVGWHHQVHFAHQTLPRNLTLLHKAQKTQVFLLEHLAACLENRRNGDELWAVTESIDDVFFVDEVACLVALHHVVVL